MKKRDLILLAVIFAVALCGWLAYRAFMPGGEEALVYVGNELYGSYDLSQDQTVTVEQGDGKYNLLVIADGGIRMAEANCSNHDCIRQGVKTPESVADGGNWIICLPNIVSVEVRGPSK